jgi:hypothetical protein
MNGYRQRKALVIAHEGLHLGGNLAIDNAPGKGIDVRDLTAFLCLGAGHGTPRAEVLRRAVSRIGEKNYHFFFNNCQDFRTWCQTGRATSWQANLGIVLVCLLCCAAAGGLPGMLVGLVYGLHMASLRDQVANAMAVLEIDRSAAETQRRKAKRALRAPVPEDAETPDALAQPESVEDAEGVLVYSLSIP